MTNDECRMSNDGMLSILMQIKNLMERSDFHNSSIDIRHSINGYCGKIADYYFDIMFRTY